MTLNRNEPIIPSHKIGDESIIEKTNIPSKVIYAFGDEKILFSTRVSVLDRERLSNLRNFIISNEAIYTFDDDVLERRISFKNDIQELVKYKETEENQRKSYRLLFRVNNDTDLVIICKGATGVLEAINNLLKLNIKEIDPTENDLFLMANLDESKVNQNEQVKEWENKLLNLLKNNEKNNSLIYLYTELLRRSKLFNWDESEVIQNELKNNFLKSE
jgi:hypothetical protein